MYYLNQSYEILHGFDLDKIKVHMYWEGHKIWKKNLPLRFDVY